MPFQRIYFVGVMSVLCAQMNNNAMRAAMFGAYGNDFWIELGKLALFLLPAAFIGLVLRKPLAKFMTWYVEQVESSKLVG